MVSLLLGLLLCIRFGDLVGFLAMCLITFVLLCGCFVWGVTLVVVCLWRFEFSFDCAS